MKVLLIGGTGVFGSRLARLLIRDEHHVTLAARNRARVQALASELGCDAITLDRDGDLSGVVGFDVVIDAAGPFHTHGPDPYRLARAALKAGQHYLDLSDNAAFCVGIRALDTEAQAAGRAAISGLSSVPALSSAAVSALSAGARSEVIDTAILPGNHSPRGISVMTSIRSQAGRTMRVWRSGAWEEVTGWSDPRMYDLPDGVRRQGWQIEVPDQSLFPAHFGADSVTFRAGLELAIMRYGLAAFALLRRFVRVPVNGFVVQVFKIAADLLSPLGSGRGGMSVMVVVAGERRYWCLLAEDGDGPYIPAIATRALLRRSVLSVGARPALDVITLEEAEAAMSDLRVKTEVASVPFQPIFPQVLGASFGALPEVVRKTHLTTDISRWQGRARVRRGSSLWSRFLGGLFGFPPEADEIDVEVVKTATPLGERWNRRFGSSRFRSFLAATPDGMTERFGPFTFLLGLTVEEAALHFPVKSARVGPLPLPRWLLPVSIAREYEQGGRFCFDVKLHAPVTGDLLVHYQGQLSPAPCTEAPER